MSVIVVIAWACALGWILFAALVLHGLAGRKPLLRPESSRSKDSLPLVSVLIPARNEERRILAQSLRSVLAQDYEQLEVIAVNDRSTDATLSILRAVAEEDARLLVIDGEEPRAGWLGKPYALQQALAQAKGSWVLTIDADMLLERSAVSTALNIALANDHDVLTLMPQFEARSFWEGVFIPSWVMILLGAFPFAVINHPKIKLAIAFGGFFLIERETLARINEFESVRAEIVEDVRLAELLKAAGARYRIEHAPNLLRTRMQQNFSEIWAFLKRGMFAGMRYSVTLSLLSVIVGIAFVFAPFFVALYCALMLSMGAGGACLRLFIPALLVWLIQVFTLAAVSKKLEVPVIYALMNPLGVSFFYAALLSALINVMRGRGILWKERAVYSQDGAELPSRRRRKTDASS
jgi:chlorobactene glucosyltransferase